MRGSFLLTDAGAVSALVTLGRAAERWAIAAPEDRAAAQAMVLRRVAVEAAGRDGTPTDVAALALQEGGATDTSGGRVALRFLNALRRVAASDSPTSFDTIVTAYQTFDQDTVHADAAKEDGLVRSCAEDVANSLSTPAPDALDAIAACAKEHPGRRTLRILSIVAPFHAAACLDLPFPVDLGGGHQADDDEVDVVTSILAAARTASGCVATVQGLNARYASTFERERSSSMSLDVCRLSTVVPTLTQRTVERELGVTARGALNALLRLSEPQVGILERLPGTPLARRFFLNRAVVSPLSRGA